MTDTLLDQVAERLDAAVDHNSDAEVAPVVVLWPDAGRQLEAVVDELASDRTILRLGDLDGISSGPAYWLRCAVAGTVDVDSRGDAPPVLYLPGVAKEELRAVEECPDELAPIAELQYRGAWFAHPNGRDWTIRGLLSNDERGLGLAVAGDTATSARLADVLPRLLDRPMHQLASQQIDAAFLNSLLNPDMEGRLLEWLDDPAGFRRRVDEPTWAGFVDACTQQFGFDPERDGEVTGGRLLGQREDAWGTVWARYVENPQRYAGIEARLRAGKPTDVLFTDVEGSWPQDNEAQEKQLRSALAKLGDEPPGEARPAIRRLWTDHARRREWVWAQLDRAPLAFALEHLTRLADVTEKGPLGDLDALASSYGQDGWRADDAFLKAVAAAPVGSDRDAVAAAGMAMYRPWLDAHARAFQEAVVPDPSVYRRNGEASTEPGTVTVFVDGLRLDVAHRVVEALGDTASVETGLAALPTVTATAKPVLTPTPEGALASGGELGAARATSGAAADLSVLRSMMKDRGGQVLGPSDVGDADGWAWTESAEIDSRGHRFGLSLVDELDREVDTIVKRVGQLLEAGWSQVHVVTDHGWLLVPSGMPKAELPVHTTVTRKGRCARLKEDADVVHDSVPWAWDDDVRIAVAPGIHCFEANKEYEHGGISPQECVVPRIVVRAASGTEPVTVTQSATISSVKWLGLMCRIQYDQVATGATVDIRALPADATTSVAATAKETTTTNKAALHVADEELEGETAWVVLVDPDGRVLAQRHVTIGHNK